MSIAIQMLMKISKTVILLSALFVSPFLIPQPVDAQDQDRLTSRASQNFRNAIRRANARAAQRPIRPIERIRLNNTVYRYEGNANVVHEEVSSPEVMFHIDNDRIVAGHAWDRQAR